MQFEVKHGSSWNHGLVETFRALGYAIYRLVPGLNVLVPVDVRAGMDVFQLNLFAVKPDRAALMSARGILTTEHHVTSDRTSHRRWQAMLRDLPYARSFGTNWRWDLATDAGEQERLHASALDAFASAHDIDATATQRIASLGSAARFWTRLHGATPEHPVFGLCLARCFAALGERAAALGVLWRTAEGATGSHRLARELPLLPPLPAQDAQVPGADIDSWIQAVRAEAIEVLHAHSSYFRPGHGAHLDAMLTSPEVSTAMRRRHRLQTVRNSDPLAVATLTRDASWVADGAQAIRAHGPGATDGMGRRATAAH